MDVSRFSLFGQILNLKDAFAREKLLKVSTDDKPVPLYRLMELKYDGTDDITNALNNAESSIYIPEGVFLISKPVTLKYSLYGAGSSREPSRQAGGTIIKCTFDAAKLDNGDTYANTNLTIDGVLYPYGALNITSNSATGNIVIDGLSIITNSYSPGILVNDSLYIDCTVANVAVTTRGFGFIVAPKTLQNRHCYFYNVSAWAASDRETVERYDGATGFYFSENACDNWIENATIFNCQTAIYTKGNNFFENITIFSGIPANGAGGEAANSWWEQTIGFKIENQIVHCGTLYIDTVNFGFVFDGDKSGAFVNNIAYTINDAMATTTPDYSFARLLLKGTTPAPVFKCAVMEINKTGKFGSIVGKTSGDNKDCYIEIGSFTMFTPRDLLFSDNNYYVASGEHRVPDYFTTRKNSYTLRGHGDETEVYKMAFVIPKVQDKSESRGFVYVSFGNAMYQVFMSAWNGGNFASAVNTKKNFENVRDGGATQTIQSSIEETDILYRAEDDNCVMLFVKAPKNSDVQVEFCGFNSTASPVILDCIFDNTGAAIVWPEYPSMGSGNKIKCQEIKLT